MMTEILQVSYSIINIHKYINYWIMIAILIALLIYTPQ